MTRKQKFNLIAVVLVSILILVVTHYVNKYYLSGPVFDAVALLIRALAILIPGTMIYTSIIKVVFHGNPKEGVFKHLKRLLIIVGVLVLLFTYEPPYATYWFHIKHISFFGILAFVAVFLAVKRYLYIAGTDPFLVDPDKFRQSNRNFAKFYLLIAVTIFLIVVSNLQIWYINRYHIPPIYGCSYYDDYNHLIYESQFKGVCPELENVEIEKTETGSKLSFTVEEEYVFKEGLMYEHDLRKEVEKKVITSEIEYQYDSLGRVTDYSITYIEDDYHIGEGRGDEIDYIFTKTIQNTYGIDTVKSVHTTNNAKIIYHSKLVIPASDGISDGEIVVNRCDDLSCSNEASEGQGTEQMYNILINYEDNQVSRFLSQSDEFLELTEYAIYDSSFANRFYLDQFIEEQDTSQLSRLVKEVFYSKDTDFLKNISINMDEFQVNHEVEIHDKRIILSSDHQDYNLLTIIEEQEYGTKLKHHNLRRQENGMYPKTHADGDQNLIGVNIKQFNDYTGYMLSPNYKKVQFIYQKNPLLFDYEEDFKQRLTE
ncbi:hypothetical protein [Haloplasma contractile]|uniref:Uncharacterized protein n=1 Tax=Haloplasma contractile SSD-17B TaxID=1033810 RepID=U2E9N8_9MOLU|nr:hypothetical protein [Haloplasma contractile]ERJ11853.1 hypothetical protein HLPCO_002093 [Haloplasma contractile SSD-17B]